MASFLELSHELLHCCIIELDPTDLASLCQTCQTLNAYIRGNALLHKEVYVRRYDEPSSKRGIEPKWEQEIQNAVKLEKILESEDREMKRREIGFVAERINAMLETACVDPDESLNVQLLSEHFSSSDNIDTFLCSSSLFGSGGTDMQQPAPTDKLRQASAKLHCLYGKPVDPVPNKRCTPHYGVSVNSFFTVRGQSFEISSSPSSNTRTQTRGTPAHTVARSTVYDLRKYTINTLWGPFMDDGSQNIDWEKVEAVMLVLGFNLSKFTERSSGRFPLVWNDPFAGATPMSYISPPPSVDAVKDLDEDSAIALTPSASLDLLDPYGVTGTWMRVVCFLDYNDLYAFNFSHRIPDHESREPIDTEEGIINVKESVSHHVRQIPC